MRATTKMAQRLLGKAPSAQLQLLRKLRMLTRAHLDMCWVMGTPWMPRQLLQMVMGALSTWGMGIAQQVIQSLPGYCHLQIC